MLKTSRNQIKHHRLKKSNSEQRLQYIRSQVEDGKMPLVDEDVQWMRQFMTQEEINAFASAVLESNANWLKNNGLELPRSDLILLTSDVVAPLARIMITANMWMGANGKPPA